MRVSEAIRLDSQLALGYVNRALAYTVLGEDKEAQQDVDRAVGLGIDLGILECALEDAKKQR